MPRTHLTFRCPLCSAILSLCCDDRVTYFKLKCGKCGGILKGVWSGQKAGPMPLVGSDGPRMPKGHPRRISFN